MARRMIGIAVVAAVVLAVVLVLALRGGDEAGDEATSGGPTGAGATNPRAADESSEVADSASATPKPAPSIVAPAPSDGTIEETIAPSPRGRVVTADAEDAARLPDDVVVRLIDVERRDVEPGGPGDVGGAAVVVRLELENSSEQPIDVDTVMVTLTQRGGRVAQPLTAEPYDPFRGSLDPGESARSSYVFATPTESPNSFDMLVEYVAGSGIARFGELEPR